MSCDIANGRLEPCKDSVGGINAVYFVNYGELGSITYGAIDTDVIDVVSGTPNLMSEEALRIQKAFNQVERMERLCSNKF